LCIRNFDSFYRLCIENFNYLGLRIRNFNNLGLRIRNFNNLGLRIRNFNNFGLRIRNFNNLGLRIRNYNGRGLCIRNFNNFRLSVSNDDCLNSRFFNDLVRMDNNFGKYFATGAEYGCEMYQDEHNCYTPGHHCTHRNQQTHVPFSVTRRSTPHE
jgi:hypothetical protein